MSFSFFMDDQKGFTLMEMLVVTAILALVAGVAISLITSVIRSYHKSNILNRLQETGSQVLAVIEGRVRGASQINWGTCNGSGNLTITYDNQPIVFSCSSCGVAESNGYIAMSVDGAASQPLTSNNAASGVNVSALSFTCDSSTGEVIINLSLEQPTGLSGRLENRASLNFSKTVVARSTYSN